MFIFKKILNGVLNEGGDDIKFMADDNLPITENIYEDDCEHCNPDDLIDLIHFYYEQEEDMDPDSPEFVIPDTGMQMIVDLADQLPYEVIHEIVNYLKDYLDVENIDLDDPELNENDQEPSSANAGEETDTSFPSGIYGAGATMPLSLGANPNLGENYSYTDLLVETVLQEYKKWRIRPKQRRQLMFRKRAVKRLGKRTGTIRFKLTMRYDKKRRKFIRRPHPLNKIKYKRRLKKWSRKMRQKRIRGGRHSHMHHHAHHHK